MKKSTMKPFLLSLFFIVVCKGLSAQFYGPSSCTSTTTASLYGNAEIWTNTNNAGGSDNNYATFGDIPGGRGNYTDYLVATGFGFNPPYGTVIKGIVVEVERSDPNGLTSDFSVRIVIGGLIMATEKSEETPYPTTDAYQTYGSPTDLWGETWNYKDVANDNFGVAIAAQRNASGGVTAGRIDNIRITVYFDAAILPVTLTSFSAVKENKKVVLNWNTATETNMNHYEVERSSNGRNFYSLTSIPGLNQAVSDYSYTDNSPFSGVSYYRLKMEGTGYQKYSKIISVRFDNNNTITLSPCPWTKGNDLFINNPKSEVLRIQFYDSNGQLVCNAVTTADRVPTNNLPGTGEKLFYRVFDAKSQLLGSGTLLIL
jgi:hypothetical protein